MVTTVTSTIGSGGGRTYSTLSSWEAATDNDLVAADEIQVGEMYADSTFTAGMDLNGAVTDATRYRVLQAASGHEYDIRDGTGVLVSGGSSSNVNLTIRDTYTRLKGIAVQNNDTVSTPSYRFNYDIRNATNCLLEECVGLNMTNYSSYYGPGYRIYGDGDYAELRNCIQVGAIGADLTGTMTGFQCLGGADDCTFDNCLAYSIRGAGNGNTRMGFLTVQANTTMRNCIAMETLTGGIAKDFNTGGAGSSFDYNASGDTSASGANSLTGRSHTTEWTDPANFDFMPKDASALVDAGEDQSATFTQSIVPGAAHGPLAVGWEMGPYSVVPFGYWLSIRSFDLHFAQRAGGSGYLSIAGNQPSSAEMGYLLENNYTYCGMWILRGASPSGDETFWMTVNGVDTISVVASGEKTYALGVRHNLSKGDIIGCRLDTGTTVEITAIQMRFRRRA